MSATLLPTALADRLRAQTPLLWLNDNWRPVAALPWSRQDGLKRIAGSKANVERFAPLLAQLFPDLAPSAGRIASDLSDAAPLQPPGETAGRWFIKGDHALPVAGSVKARGGLYEVLRHAFDVAQDAGLDVNANILMLASPEAKALFQRRCISVGSTGNLGLSIGIMAAALGFKAVVHMSADAKAWKKDKLRAAGVRVVEHEGDFGDAVAAGREDARQDDANYFVDDENSPTLFDGYSVAAFELRDQLEGLGLKVGPDRPLFVYLPCGVGGAPGGITFGLRHVFGDRVHCFTAEPVGTPSMLVQLIAPASAPSLSVRDIGIDAHTEADGLAVASASTYVAPLMRPLLSGCFTVRDETLFQSLYLLEQKLGLKVEPSAAAAFEGPSWITASEQGQVYLARHNISASNAIHVIWTTGGIFVPDKEYKSFHQRGQTLAREASGAS